MFNSLRQRFAAVTIMSARAGLRLLVLPAIALAGCVALPSAPDMPALAVDDFHVPS
jgi:hypothetical protein